MIEPGTSKAGVPVQIEDSQGNIIDPALKPAPLTAASPTFATVGVTSAQVIGANSSRKSLVFVNTSANTISFGIGTTAVLNSGITLTQNGVWETDYFSYVTSAINAIASAGSSNLTIQEFT